MLQAGKLAPIQSPPRKFGRHRRDCSWVWEPVGENRSWVIRPSSAHVRKGGDVSVGGVMSRRVSSHLLASRLRREIRQSVDLDSNDWCCTPSGSVRHKSVKLPRLWDVKEREKGGTHFRRHFPFSLQIEIHRDRNTDCDRRLIKRLVHSLGGGFRLEERVANARHKSFIARDIAASGLRNFYSHKSNIHRLSRRFIVAGLPRVAMCRLTRFSLIGKSRARLCLSGLPPRFEREL